MNKTSIEWCDHTASPWYGCTEVHAGCDNCYARELAKWNPSTLGVWGDDGTRVKSKSFIRNLRLWNKQAAQAGRIASVFPSLCDPFEDRPELEPWRREMFDVIDECPHLRLLLLTKRPQNVRRMWAHCPCEGGYCTDPQCDWPDQRRNVWLLTSVSDQPTAATLIPPLLDCRDLVPVIGVSAEPLLGPIEICPCRWREDGDRASLHDVRCPLRDNQGINWVIVGGESGPNHRPCAVSDITGIVDQCRAAGVACFVKQDSALKPGQQGRLSDEVWGVKEFPAGRERLAKEQT